MSFIHRLNHVQIKAEGNEPLLLSGPRGWLVQTGQADIFAVRWYGDGAVGSRHYLFTVSGGGLLPGVELQDREGESFALLAVGHPDTHLLEFGWPAFSALAADEAVGAEAVELLRGWMQAWPDHKIVPSGELDLSGGFPREQWEAFNRAALAREIEKILLSRKEAVQRHQRKARQDQAHMAGGLHRLMRTVDPQAEYAPGAEASWLTSPLFKACAEVGRAKKIAIVPIPELQQNRPENKDLLEAIARASQIRMRQVILKDDWWQEDNGALLAYKRANGRPVALLPVSPRRYALYDPEDESRCLVDEATADTLQPRAYTFYRPLPAEIRSYKDLLRYLLDGIWKQDAAMVLIMGILGGLLGMLTPMVSGKIFDTVIPDGERVLLIQIGFLLLTIALTIFAFNLTRAFAMHRIEGRTEADLQAAVWDRLLSLPVSFYKRYSAGELAGRALGISEMRSVLSGAAVNATISGIFSIFYLILLFYYSKKLALLVLVVVAVVMGVSLLYGALQIRYERQLIDLNNFLSGKVFGLLSGVSKIKTSGAEKRAFNNWAQDFAQTRDITYRKEKLGNQMAVFNSMVNVIASGIIFYALIKVKGIDLSAGKFIAFNSAFTSFLGAMLEISGVILQVNIIKPLYERTRPILDAVPECDPQKAEPGELEGNIEVSHVSFRYDQDGPLVLEDVTLEIKKGDYIGIVGPSGSGKSTLFRLLLGFESPETGQIYYDQQNLENLNIRSLRRQLGVVLQNGQLMVGSIFDNIVASHSGLTIQDAWEAARMAGMEEDIRAMPMGMHTMISEGGGTLSGGQKQRLLIARAIVSRPKIIYFDEATSALDNQTQQVVSSSLAGLGITRVVIAHRLSTIVQCNKIVVMEQGRIVECGNYQELYARNGLFTRLVNRQLA